MEAIVWAYIRGMEDMLCAVKVQFELGGIDEKDMRNFQKMIDRRKEEVKKICQ